MSNPVTRRQAHGIGREPGMVVAASDMIEFRRGSYGPRSPIEFEIRIAMNADLRRRVDDLTSRLTQLRDSL